MPHLTPKTLSAQTRLAFQDDGPTARCDGATSRRVTAGQDVCWPGLETTGLPCRPSLRGRDDSIPRAMASRQVATYRLVRHDLTHATQHAPFTPASGLCDDEILPDLLPPLDSSRAAARKRKACTARGCRWICCEQDPWPGKRACSCYRCTLAAKLCCSASRRSAPAPSEFGPAS